MTTIKLKASTTKCVSVYKAGQLFKNSNGELHILTRTTYNEVGMVAIQPKDSFVRFGKQKLFPDYSATLDFINNKFNENFTPISVTISED